ncbi:MAG: hypothetical protein ACLFVG_04365 [Candidatus Aminicenantes bacterium]
MKSKISILIAASFLFSSCLASLQVKKQRSSSYENISFSQVWEAALKSVEDMGFTIKEANKEEIKLPAFSEWKGVISAEGEKNALTQVKPPQLYVTLREKGGRIEVDCQATQPRQMIDYGETKKNLRRFFEYLSQNLSR